MWTHGGLSIVRIHGRHIIKMMWQIDDCVWDVMTFGRGSDMVVFKQMHQISLLGNKSMTVTWSI